MARHEVVGGVEPCAGEDPEHREQPPGPAEGRRDGEHRARTTVQHGAPAPIALDDVDGREVHRAAAEWGERGGRGGALERREAEDAAPVAGENEAHRGMAEPALAVVEQQVRRARLRFTMFHDIIVNMVTENSKPKRRGRPPGRTPAGEASRQRLYETAIALISEHGYEAATLRDVAARAKVSPALLYRYFPNKSAIVLALYDELSESLATKAAALPAGRWRDRFLRALSMSLAVLGPHRVTLRALAPVLVGDTEEGVFAERTAFSRVRVQAVFRAAVVEARDAPPPALAEALGRLLYLLHLGVILWWLLDRSPRQRATRALVALVERMLPSVQVALHLPAVRGFVTRADALFVDGLLGGSQAS